jgi:dienelactone hydrolase
MAVPTMILIGGADDWTPAVACQAMVAQPHGDGARLDLTVYPGAYHAFNFPGLKPGIPLTATRSARGWPSSALEFGMSDIIV